LPALAGAVVGCQLEVEGVESEGAGRDQGAGAFAGVPGSPLVEESVGEESVGWLGSCGCIVVSPVSRTRRSCHV
jgi:hypothetical protein